MAMLPCPLFQSFYTSNPGSLATRNVNDAEVISVRWSLSTIDKSKIEKVSSWLMNFRETESFEEIYVNSDEEIKVDHSSNNNQYINEDYMMTVLSPFLMNALRFQTTEFELNDDFVDKIFVRRIPDFSSEKINPNKSKRFVLRIQILDFLVKVPEADLPSRYVQELLKHWKPSEITDDTALVKPDWYLHLKDSGLNDTDSSHDITGKLCDSKIQVKEWQNQEPKTGVVCVPGTRVCCIYKLIDDETGEVLIDFTDPSSSTRSHIFTQDTPDVFPMLNLITYSKEVGYKCDVRVDNSWISLAVDDGTEFVRFLNNEMPDEYFEALDSFPKSELFRTYLETKTQFPEEYETTAIAIKRKTGIKRVTRLRTKFSNLPKVIEQSYWLFETNYGGKGRSNLSIEKRWVEKYSKKKLTFKNFEILAIDPPEGALNMDHEERLEACDSLRRQGNVLFSLGDFKRSYSRYCDAQLYVGNLYNKSDPDLDDSTQKIDKARDLAIKCLCNAALAAWKLDDVEATLKESEKALIVDPCCTKALFKKAQCLEKKNQMSDCIEYLDKARKSTSARQPEIQEMVSRLDSVRLKLKEEEISISKKMFSIK